MIGKIYRLTTPPPSVNGLFANVKPGKGKQVPTIVKGADGRARVVNKSKQRSRIKTKAYKSWINEAGWEVKRQGLIHIPGGFGIELVLPRSVTQADLDNLIKALPDLLKTMGVVPDDAPMNKVGLEFVETGELQFMVYERAMRHTAVLVLPQPEAVAA